MNRHELMKTIGLSTAGAVGLGGLCSDVEAEAMTSRVNTPREEDRVPGQIIKKLGIRNEIVVSARCCHRMKGLPGDRDEVYQFVDERLKQWQTDHFDILMLTNETYDMAQSGYWDMSYCIEALERVKDQGKARFTGFGCHFEPESFLNAIEKHGDFFDVVSFPYNIRHRAAERIMPVATILLA